MIANNHSGKIIKPFVEGEPLSASHFNEIVAVFNALLRLTIVRRAAVADPIGSTSPIGVSFVSNENMIWQLDD